MLAVIIPAHDEEEHIGACLRSLNKAARCPRLNGEPVLIVVALDSCTDNTRAIVLRWQARSVAISARNVGLARAAGAEHALEMGSRWLAFTDADSTVAPDWLAAQLEQRCEAVCGTVQVRDWRPHSAAVRRQHALRYTNADGHRHIHGANFGVSAAAYRAAGGFMPLTSSEDVALVAALRRDGASIAWSAAPRVVTSARRDFRAPRGFGQTLLRLEREVVRGEAAWCA